MKRLAAVILAGVMVFGLAACGGNEDAGNSTEAASGTESDKGTADSGSKIHQVTGTAPMTSQCIQGRRFRYTWCFC